MMRLVLSIILAAAAVGPAAAADNGVVATQAAVDPYPDAYHASAKDCKPLLVYVGQPARAVDGCRAISVKEYPQATAPSVVVGVVRDGSMWRTDLPATADAASVKAAVSAVLDPGAAAIAEVNATRAARGLRPYTHDPLLSAGAKAVSAFRAARHIAGHSSNDFGFLPAGASARAAGCAAWAPGMGWGACCTYENWTYCGAAWTMGADGRRYMHLFVR